MKKSVKTFVMSAVVITSMALVSCGKNKCEECHYELANGSEAELGEFCGDEMKDLEKNGYTDSTGTTYDVHCGGH
jgi:ferredoxin